MEDHLFSIPSSSIDWLLNSQTPSIRYLTFEHLIHLNEEDDDVRTTRAEISKTDYVKAIIAKQNPQGYWYSERHYYGPKFRGTHWSMLLLTELAVSPELPALQNGAEFMLRRMNDGEDGYHTVKAYYEEEAIGFCCYWGNWLRYQIYRGNLEHPLVERTIDFVCRDIQRNGKCPHNADLPCAWAVIRSLFGLALIPIEKQNEAVKTAIQHGIDFVINEHDPTRANYPSRGEAHTTWNSVSFPLFYHTDILFTLRVLAELKALNQPGARNALAWLAERRRSDGTWRGASPFKNRSHPFLTLPDTPSHWVTLHALSVLSAANQQMGE